MTTCSLRRGSLDNSLHNLAKTDRHRYYNHDRQSRRLSKMFIHRDYPRLLSCCQPGSHPSDSGWCAWMYTTTRTAVADPLVADSKQGLITAAAAAPKQVSVGAAYYTEKGQEPRANDCLGAQSIDGGSRGVELTGTCCHSCQGACLNPADYFVLFRPLASTTRH